MCCIYVYVYIYIGGANLFWALHFFIPNSPPPHHWSKIAAAKTLNPNLQSLQLPEPEMREPQVKDLMLTPDMGGDPCKSGPNPRKGTPTSWVVCSFLLFTPDSSICSSPQKAKTKSSAAIFPFSSRKGKHKHRTQQGRKKHMYIYMCIFVSSHGRHRNSPDRLAPALEVLHLAVAVAGDEAAQVPHVPRPHLHEAGRWFRETNTLRKKPFGCPKS